MATIDGSGRAIASGWLRPEKYSPQFVWAAVLTLFLVFGQALPAARFFSSPAHYLPFHTVLEFLSMVVAGMVFALGWNLRRHPNNSDNILLGVGFLAVCLIDVAHTLSYPGMPEFVTPSGPEKAINFWLAARYMAAASLLAVALFPLHRWSLAASNGLLLGAIVVAAAVWWAGLMHQDWFPRTFEAVRGLTPFKKGAEYLLAGIYASAALLLLRNRRGALDDKVKWLAAAAWVLGLAEMFFTLYGEVTDLFNFLGHIYKVIAYMMVYRAMFVAGVRAPYGELALERSRLLALLAAIPDPVFVKDARGLFLSCNKAVERLFGAPEERIVGRTDHDFMPRELADLSRENDRAAMAAGRPLDNEEWLTRVTDGYRGLFETTRTPLYVDGQVVGTLGIAHDITARKQTEADLRIAAAAFESQAAAMVVTDAQGVILRVNQMFSESTGYSAAECVGQTPRLLRSGVHAPDFYRQMWLAVRTTGNWQGEIWDRRKSGELYPKWLTISAVRGDGAQITHYIGIHTDITERKKAEDKIHELAFFDQLTGLPNRTLLQDRLKQAAAISGRSDSHGALLFIDLDHFKTLNDTLGHDVGDSLLKQVGARLTRCVRQSDTVARLGGDEFVVILADLGANEREAAMAAETVAKHILAELGQPYQLGNVLHHSAASIGATLFKGALNSIDSLMKQTDLAMYKAKGAGRNTVRFFDPAMEIAVRERAALEEDLRRAVADSQLLLHYQVQIGGDGRVEGAEALLRWQHPGRGMVAPAEFIPLAEETGDILSLGQWVLETAAGQLVKWAGQPGMAHLTLAVNVSALQLRQADFVEQVLAVLEKAGANPRQLKLELTESLLVEDVEGIIGKMLALKEHGVRFSLDDFGTGYSSLSYLKRLPLDQLKIDQSFVRDVLTDPNDAAIARSVVALAHSLGLGVIAEGVETEVQRDFLAGIGCHSYQGYLFGRPLPVADFEALVQRA